MSSTEMANSSLRREIRFGLGFLRLVLTRPVNILICAILFELLLFLMDAPYPLYSLLGNATDNPLKGKLATALYISAPFFALYLLIRVVRLCAHRRWRWAFFSACALWALTMPVAMAVFFEADRYGNVASRHALVARLFAADDQLRDAAWVKANAPRLIDRNGQCYPGYSGYGCLILIVDPATNDAKLDVGGGWHAPRSKTLQDLLPAYVRFGKVDVRPLGPTAYSVLTQDYDGR